MAIYHAPEYFQCDNPDCSEVGKINKIHVWSDRKSNPLCIVCKRELVVVIPEYKSSEGPYYGKFASMSPIEKRQVLKKRSHEHFKKEIKEKKDWMDKNYK